MLHIEATTKRQAIQIPRGRTKVGAEHYTLLLYSSVNRAEINTTTADYGADFAVDFARDGVKFVVGVYYIEATLNFNPVPQSGEYYYCLLDDGEVVSEGLAVIGDATKEIETYNGKAIYEQYNG